MIPCDHDDGGFEVYRDAAQYLVKQSYGLRRWNGPVVDVSGHEHRMGFALGNESDELFEDVRLIIGQVNSVKKPPEMPV